MFAALIARDLLGPLARDPFSRLGYPFLIALAMATFVLLPYWRYREPSAL
jgi:hypothetical protein